MMESLSTNRGKITPEIIMEEIVPNIAMPSNFHNVIYEPRGLQFWVNNALNPKNRAAEQPYSHFNLKAGLKKHGF
jgi:hypothetical protein